MQRIAAGVFAACEIVCHCLDFQDVQAAKVGDLFEGQAGVIDQPSGGRMRHERGGLVGHGKRLCVNLKIEGPPLAERPLPLSCRRERRIRQAAWQRGEASRSNSGRERVSVECRQAGKELRGCRFPAELRAIAGTGL